MITTLKLIIILVLVVSALEWGLKKMKHVRVVLSTT